MTPESLFRRCISIEYTHIEGAGSYAYEIIGDTLYIYFEKSNGLVDWKNNLDFPAKSYTGCGCFAHRGFLRVWKSLLPYIEDILQHKSFEGVVITGYSHGGALAVLCHEHIWFNYPHLQCVLTGYGFGSPRVIWGILGKKRHRWDNFKIIRNENDIVTHLPPFIFGYRHVGTLIRIGKKGRYSLIDAHRQENILFELGSTQYF